MNVFRYPSANVSNNNLTVIAIIISVCNFVTTFSDLLYFFKAEVINYVSKILLLTRTFSGYQPYRKIHYLFGKTDDDRVWQKKPSSSLDLGFRSFRIHLEEGVAVISPGKDCILKQIVSEVLIGIIIEPENEDQLYNAIVEQIRSDNSGISSRARTFAEKHLNKDIILANFELELQQLLAKEKRR